ncbi:MAG: ATP-binding protein, partial [Plesiomonas shigelloides]
RHHTGNLAHALKTPLAVLNNQIALLPPAEQAQLQAPLKQLREQIESHLARARIAGASNILAVRCQPALRVDRIALAMSKVYAARDVELINELDSELQLAVSEDDFDEMAGNLIENSFKWATSLIRVHLQASNDTSAQSAMLTLLIDDDGCGIADADRERVLQRGVRLDETTPGSGLGLNIAYEMALSYRGDLRLQPSPLGGLRAELTLPAVRR